jgi:hypothetical protein
MTDATNFSYRINSLTLQLYSSGEWSNVSLDDGDQLICLAEDKQLSVASNKAATLLRQLADKLDNND